MKSALICIRIIVAVSMTSAGMFFAQSVEGFQKYRGRLTMILFAEGGALTSSMQEGSKVANNVKRFGEDAIGAGEISTLIASGIFALISLLAVIAGECLKAEMRRSRRRMDDTR